MKLAVRTLLLFVLSFISFLSYAVTVENLSDVDIVVKNQSDSQKRAAIRSGLKTVIFRHVGDNSVFDNALIKNALTSSTNLINQFSYFQKSNELYLKIQFSEQKIIKLLREAQVPIWGKNRPLTILWISNTDGTTSQIESDTSSGDFVKSLKYSAEQIALPIVFPIMDFDEVTSVTPSDIKGSFVNQLHELNNRYDVEYYSLIALENINGKYQYRVKLFPQRQDGILRPIYQFDGLSSDISTITNAISKSLASYFSKEYSVSSNNEGSTTALSFVNVDDLAKAIDVERYLNTLTTVKSAHIKNIEHNILSVELQLYGNEADMLKLLKLDPKIKAIEPDLSDKRTIKQLYLWQQ